MIGNGLIIMFLLIIKQDTFMIIVDYSVDINCMTELVYCTVA